MFTGLIREIGKLRGIAPRGGLIRLDVEAPVTAKSAGVGDSIAVNGICLTVTAVSGRVFSVEAASETRRLTNLKNWRRGDRLHLEPALRAGDPLDGHLVQGHIDGVGTVKKVRNAGGNLLVTVDLPAALAAYLTPKGSVAVDGVSLTVDEGPFDRGFTVNLIPHTLSWTTFGDIRAGRKVNLEMDVLVKAARGAGGVVLPGVGPTPADKEKKQTSWTMDRLLAKGFGRRRS
jgi:riboflavin synthase alpha subunit